MKSEKLKINTGLAKFTRLNEYVYYLFNDTFKHLDI